MQPRPRRLGIAPVITTVIILGVGIALALAVSGVIFGWYGVFTQASAVRISSAILEADGDITVTFSNAGGSDRVTAIEVPGSVTYSVATGKSWAVSANAASLSLTSLGADPEITKSGTSTLTSGQSATVRVILQGGSTLSYMVKVS